MHICAIHVLRHRLSAYAHYAHRESARALSVHKCNYFAQTVGADYVACIYVERMFLRVCVNM